MNKKIYHQQIRLQSLPLCTGVVENKFVTFPMRSSICLLSCTSWAKAREDLQIKVRVIHFYALTCFSSKKRASISFQQWYKNCYEALYCFWKWGGGGAYTT